LKTKKTLPLFAVFCCLVMLLSSSGSDQAAASPWADKEGYGAKTGGKLAFGLKHTLFSWMNPWAEAHDPVYETRWTGFCAGIGKSVIYTAAGAIQLVTFPVPVDFPNVGLGMHIPANHLGVSAKKKQGVAALEEIPATAASLDSETALEVPALSAVETKPALDTAKAKGSETAADTRPDESSQEIPADEDKPSQNIK